MTDEPRAKTPSTWRHLSASWQQPQARWGRGRGRVGVAQPKAAHRSGALGLGALLVSGTAAARHRGSGLPRLKRFATASASLGSARPQLWPAVSALGGQQQSVGCGPRCSPDMPGPGNRKTVCDPCQAPAGNLHAEVSVLACKDAEKALQKVRQEGDHVYLRGLRDKS